MEAVPRLPMLSFELRQSSEPVDFSSKLKQYIRSHYNEDPEMFSNEINQLKGLRSAAVRPSMDFSGCSTLKRYYCQLHFLSSRFPMFRDGEAAVTFSWKHLSNNSTCSSADITLEITSILYNIGALHTQLGCADSRTTSDGMKVSCTHFQCAAWAFQHICDEYSQSPGLDLSLDLMSYMTKLCLAQAQECISEKSMMDNRKASINAKLSVQTVDYYRQALKIICDASDESSLVELVGSKLCKKWEKYLRFKISYHGCIALLFQGQQSEEQQKMGERVAFYQAAYDKLDEARKLSKGLDFIEVINEALTFVQDVVEGKRKAAKNENEFIYHENIPDINTLPNVKGASLVKGIPFNIDDIEVSGPDIFSRIVPIEAHKSSSLYSEEKAKLLRRVFGMIENKDEELETFLSTLELDKLTKIDINQLPQELIDKCAVLNAKPDAVKNLLDAMNTLSSIYCDVQGMLTEIQELLNEEELHEKEYQETVGKRPPSIAATDLTREAKKYQEAHLKASESNQTLQKAMVLHLGNIKLLSLPPKELINHLPQIVERDEVETNSKELRHLVDKINEMKQQRILLSDRLRESVYQDDILRKVVTYTGENIQSLFDSELQKHQQTVSLIEQNLTAQDNILRAMKDAYARYGTTRKSTSEMYRKREAVVASLLSSFNAYEDLLVKSAKGLDFYKKLELNVSKLLQRVRGTCKVQDEEREQLMKNVKNSNIQEVNSSKSLKLKDYLDMKKEFGKLSLDNAPLPKSNIYYKTDSVTNHQPPTWIPSVRPAPVGSEGTEANSINRMDSYANYYQAPNRDQSWSIASESNTQMVDERVRYYPQSSMPAGSPYMYSMETNQQPIKPLSGSGVDCNNTTPSHSVVYDYPAYELGHTNPEAYASKPTVAPNYVTPCDQTQWNYYSTDTSNPTTVYDDYNLPNTSVSHQFPFKYASPDLKLQCEYSQNGYGTTSNYLDQTNPQSSNYYNPPWQPTYDTNVIGSLGSNSLYNNPKQHLQSGNDSLYTVSNTNTYALANSDMYRNTDQNYGYANQLYYANQNYINQYGASNGQNECGTNFGSSVTYMQDSTEKLETTTTTYSNSDAKSSAVSEHSNVDLLAGLDFSVNQTPLIPESSIPVVDINSSSKVEEIVTVQEDKVSISEATDLRLHKDAKVDVPSARDSFLDAEKLKQLSQEVEKYEKFVESLTIKTLNGPTCLDLKWKEIADLQDKSNHLHIISVARCYPMKNRFPDILPYDDSRVELPSTKDDYINASLMKNLTPLAPNFILTQSPLPSTYSDFWAMVFEHQVEVIVCLLNDSELDGHIYWPSEKGQELAMGKLKVNLQSCNVKTHWIERIMSITACESRSTRVVIHLQFQSWPGSSFPESPGPFLSFVTECINFFTQQRSQSHPAVVHCTSGVGRTGLFCLTVACVLDINAGKGIPDLVTVTGRMCQYRKSCLRDREHLKFAYQAVLYYSQDLLMKHGILTNRSVFEDKKIKEGKCHTRHPSEDFLLGPPTDLTQLQSGIEKLGFESPAKRTESDIRAHSTTSQSDCSIQESVTNSCTSSGKSSPSSLPSDVLTSLDPANFSLKLDSNKGKMNSKKRFTTESFTRKSEMSLDAFNTDSDDPLNRLDPLWTMKK